MTKKIEIHAIAQGRVQGVGFRAKVAKLAEQFNITGFVKNLPNGDVEIVAQGVAEDVNLFFSKIENNPGFAHVTNLIRTPSSIIKSYSFFSINHS